MRTKLLVQYAGKKVKVNGVQLLRWLADAEAAAPSAASPGTGTYNDPFKPRTLAKWRGLTDLGYEAYYHVGISMLRTAFNNYVYIEKTARTDNYSNINATYIYTKNTSVQVTQEKGKYFRSFQGPGKSNTAPKEWSSTPPGDWEEWQAPSYPEYVSLLTNDPSLKGWAASTVAYLIRCTLTDDYPTDQYTTDTILKSQRLIDALTLTMFGAEAIRNKRQLCVQLMFLDLMQAKAKFGKAVNHDYSLARAFNNPSGTTKGGKLPHMAFNTYAEGKDTTFKKPSVTDPTSLNQVNRKEITILVHWLEHKLIQTVYHVDEGFDDLKKGMHEKNVKETTFTDVSNDNGHGLVQEIKKLFKERAKTTAMMLEKEMVAV
jgi:hypothetical protein